MKTNCRNCKWAEWSKNAAGRREFLHYAQCTFPMNCVIPASRPALMSSLTTHASVYEHKDIHIECAAWQPDK